MKKTRLTERFQQLAGIKPLYENSKEDQLKMAYAAYDKAEMDGDIRGQELALAAIDLIKDKPFKGLSKPSRKDQDTDDYGRSISGKDKRTFVDPKDLTAAARAKKLFKKYISTYEKVEFVYTEQGGRFYGLDVYENKDQNQRSDKLGYDDANEWLKDTLSDLAVDIPERYGSGMEELDNIVEKLEDLGIEASHGDYMDVS